MVLNGRDCPLRLPRPGRPDRERPAPSSVGWCLFVLLDVFVSVSGAFVCLLRNLERCGDAFSYGSLPGGGAVQSY